MTHAARSRQFIEDNGAGMIHTSVLGMNRRNRPPDVPVPAPGDHSPVAYLIEQAPDSRIEPHFHAVAQFQLVVDGTGLLGKHVLSRGCVHYANARTPYGPIVAGPQGLAYLTLRVAWDPGSRYMPAERDALRAAPDRVPGELTVPVDLTLRPTPGLVPLIAIDASSLGLWRCRMPAGTAATGPDPVVGAGQFWVVMAGALASGDVLGPGSCVFVARGEPAFFARAGGDGADLIVMRFPAADVPRNVLQAAKVSASA